MSTKPAIVIYGNCNAAVLNEALTMLPAVAEQFELYWTRSFTTDGYVDGSRRIDAEILRRCAFFFEQIGSFRDDFLRRNSDLKDIPLPPGCRRFRFQPLFMNTLWPFVWEDPRNASTRAPALGEGAYPKGLCNRLIGELLREESDPERVYQRFMEIRIRDKVDLDRLHALTLGKIRALDRDSDIMFGDVIESRFATERLFLMYLHPNGPLLRYLCQEAFRLLDVPADQAIGRLAVLESYKLGTYEAPIHPEIVEHFGLKWAEGLKYRHHDDGAFTHGEFVQRYIRFDYAREYYLGASFARQGNFPEAFALLGTAIQRPNAPAKFFEEYGRVSSKLGYQDIARAAFRGALQRGIGGRPS